MKLYLLICLIVGAATFAGGARTEDGIPDTPISARPAPGQCVEIDLDGQEDYLIGLSARECVDGGQGSNQIETDGNRDWINGKDGSDPIIGGDGQDTIFGGKSGDSLEGGTGDDYIYAGCPGGCDQTGVTIRNIAYGQDGDDTIGLRNNIGADEAHCGTGFDLVYLDTKSVKLGGLYDTADGSCEDVRRG